MYVSPDTTIYILQNVPLNKSYENTVYYSDAATQATAFMAYRKFTLSNYSYQRTQLGTIRVQLKYEQLYNCNYLMFKNTSFENKWFYAFITGVAYISNEVSEIYYELDVMQTWCYDYEFMPCFVERRHSTDDKLYDNYQPEGLDIGPAYNTIKAEFHSVFEEGTYYCMIASDVPDGNQPSGWSWYSGLVNNIFTGLRFGCTINANDYSTLTTLINQYNNSGKADAVVALYQSASGSTANTRYFSFVKDPTWGGTSTRYQPVNNKLHCYPYEKITVTNNHGVSRDFLPQLLTWSSDDNSTRFRIDSCSFPEAQVRIEPVSYYDGNTGVDNSISYGTLPTCSFASDTFKVWWAQNRNNYLASMNAIGRTYDTNQAIAQNNYQMAARSANASAMMSNNSTNTSLANATALNNTALSNAQRSTNVGMASGAVGAIGNALSLNIGGTVNSLMGMANTGVNYINTQDTIATQQANANATAGTALANTGIALSTALKNASTSQASASLSALTAKQNATAQLVAKKQDIQNLPDTAKGNATCGDILNIAISGGGFTIMQECIKNDYARIVDNYFTVYGYAQNDLYSADDLADRLANRPYFAYLKTVGCSIKGNLNSNDQIAIQSIYDNGITTWDKLEDVGNYSLSNLPKTSS